MAGVREIVLAIHTKGNFPMELCQLIPIIRNIHNWVIFDVEKSEREI